MAEHAPWTMSEPVNIQSGRAISSRIDFKMAWVSTLSPLIPPVAEHPVVEQGKATSFVDAEKRRYLFPSSWPRRTDLAEPDVAGNTGKVISRRMWLSWSSNTGRPKTVVPLLAYGLGNTALFPFDDLSKARGTVGDSMFPHLDADPTPAHFMGDSGDGTGAEEAVEDEIAGVCGDVEDELDETFRFWAFKCCFFTENRMNFFF
uniref:Uncharacterized protein n=1 Tax=Candidatus Kentrum sp. FW TaxID=2126338 RepID=A0A450TNU1_9GAMM|nr:MAG: hypothetical protein BECKFW1821C_GA0114237_10196 [Candidatus Kentron sp. FW]